MPPPTPCASGAATRSPSSSTARAWRSRRSRSTSSACACGDDALEAAIAAGASRSADAASAVAASPLRERTVILLMRSYAVEGRTAEAMHTAAAYRRRLVEETGLDPSPALGTWERLVAAGSLAPSRVRTTSAVRTPAGPLVGRDQDLAELLRLLDTQPVLTVTGPGGVGKTRLTLQAAAEHSERTGAESVAVRLATVTDGGRVPEAVAAALGLRLVGDAAPETVARMLTGRAVLLVLDNCEHVVDAVRDLAVALHEVAPTVRLLATSRVTLHVPGEFVVRLQPLPLPRDGDLARLGHQPSVQAFVEHARLRGRDFTPTPGDSAVLVDVVRRLDGLPLAIELAAGQLGAVPLSALHERLGRALDALSARRPTSDARHETLRATIDWSYRLLDPADRAVLRSLAPFPAGVDLETFERLSTEAAPASDPLTVLARLVDHSLVDAAQEELPRYRLLETIRTFLLDDLDARGERTEAETRFLRWASQTAAEISTAVRGEAEAAADHRLRAELANLRAARDLSRGRGDVELRIDLTLALDDAATWRDLTELWAWAVELERDPLLRGNPRENAVRASAAEASWLLGDLDGAARLARSAIDAAGDSPGVVSAWSASAAVALFRGDHPRAAQDWAAAAARSPLPSPYLASGALALAYAGDASGADTLLADATRALALGPSPSHRAWLRVRRRRADRRERPRCRGRELHRGGRPRSGLWCRVHRGGRRGRAGRGTSGPGGRARSGRGLRRAAALLVGGREPDPALDDRARRGGAARRARSVASRRPPAPGRRVGRRGVRARRGRRAASATTSWAGSAPTRPPRSAPGLGR